jgi:hypothetical protein
MATQRKAAAKASADTEDQSRSLPPNTVTLVNPGSSGVVYDIPGHSLGGGERVTVPYPLDKVGLHVVAKGYLLVDTWTPGAEAPDADEEPSPEDGSKSESDGGESDQPPSDQVG